VLDHDEEVLREFRELLAERPTSTRHKTIRTRQRQAAGLSLVQAARRLGVTRNSLEAIEAQQADPLPWLGRKMIQLYGLDPEPEPINRGDIDDART
jgi:DNA-binding XRE family transcriptional regulator